MKIKLLKSFVVESISREAGDVLDIDDQYGNKLIRRGSAEAYQEPPAQEPKAAAEPVAFQSPKKTPALLGLTADGSEIRMPDLEAARAARDYGALDNLTASLASAATLTPDGKEILAMGEDLRKTHPARLTVAELENLTADQVKALTKDDFKAMSTAQLLAVERAMGKATQAMTQ